MTGEDDKKDKMQCDETLHLQIENSYNLSCIILIKKIMTKSTKFEQPFHIFNLPMLKFGLHLAFDGLLFGVLTACSKKG